MKQIPKESFEDDWWIDQDFPPFSTSLWASKDDDEVLEESPLPNCDWVRASELTGVIADPDPSLFGDIMLEKKLPKPSKSDRNS